MSDANGPKMTNIKINPDNLYKEETFTDLTYASIRRLTPVKIDGSIDESREIFFHRNGPADVAQRTDSCSVCH